MDFEEEIKTILAAPFLSPPLDAHNIGEIRPKLEWQAKQIQELLNTQRQELLEKVELEPWSDELHGEGRLFESGYNAALEDLNELKKQL